MLKQTTVPIDVVHLLPVLDEKLIALLKSLRSEEWEMPTIAKLWKVKDVAAHLLDGNVRMLSILRDNYFGESAPEGSYEELVAYLNRLNADWVQAMKRVSPAMLVFLLETSGKPFCDYYAGLDPFGPATLAVRWAGELESKNWMHIAREYTEKWLHQQQIRDAVNKPGLMTPEFFTPFIHIFMMGLPYAYHDVQAEEHTVIKLTVTTAIGGSWYLGFKDGKWSLLEKAVPNPVTEITIDPDNAWKLFSKSIRPDDIRNDIHITGNEALGETALKMVAVMA